MRTFRVALTGDFLNAEGASAYGDIHLDLLDRAGFIQYRFILDQAPRPVTQATGTACIRWRWLRSISPMSTASSSSAPG